LFFTLSSTPFFLLHAPTTTTNIKSTVSTLLLPLSLIHILQNKKSITGKKMALSLKLREAFKGTVE
jgi:hypothetical protein